MPPARTSKFLYLCSCSLLCSLTGCSLVLTFMYFYVVPFRQSQEAFPATCYVREFSHLTQNVSRRIDASAAEDNACMFARVTYKRYDGLWTEGLLTSDTAYESHLQVKQRANIKVSLLHTAMQALFTTFCSENAPDLAALGHNGH